MALLLVDLIWTGTITSRSNLDLCFGKVILLYPLTLKLDNIVATLAKHPILCRYCWIETPTVWQVESYSYSFTYLFENAMWNCGFKEARLTTLEGNLNLKLWTSLRRQRKSWQIPLSQNSMLRNPIPINKIFWNPSPNL